MSSSDIFSFLGWSYLPNLVTGYLHTFLYNFTYRAGAQKPPPGSPLYNTHRRRIYAGVITVYLLYTLYEADWNIRRAGDFYTALGVGHDVGEKELNSRFRRLTLQLHPDKLPANLPIAHRQAAEAQLHNLQLAKDTLVDPVKRFAYDRFGPDILQWKHGKSIRDFVSTGGRRTIPFYIGSVVGLLGAQWFGVFETSGSYWRYLTLALLFLFELRTITSPTALPITRLASVLNPAHAITKALPWPLPILLMPLTGTLQSLFGTPRNPYLPFQSVDFAHRSTITVFIALGRLAPLISPPTPPGASTPEEAELALGVQKLEKLVGNYAVEAVRLLQLEGAPFTGDSSAMNGTNEAREDAKGKLLQHIKNFLVTNTIRQDPQVKAAVATVLARRRGESGHEDREQAMLQEMRDTPLEGSHHVAEGAASIASIATSTSPSTLLEVDETNMNKAEMSGAGNTTPPAQSKPMLPDYTTASDVKREIMQDELAPLDPGELADTEGETPLEGPSTHNGHQHHHKHSHGRGRSGSHLSKTNGHSLADSVDILSMSEVAEAKEAEGYEGDVEGNESGV